MRIDSYAGSVLTVFTLTIAAACGGHGGTSPTAPSVAAIASPGAPASSASGATIVGVVGGAATGASARMTVTALNSNVSSAVDDRGRFELRNVRAGRVDLRFEGAGADGRLGLDDVVERETIELAVRVAGAVVDVDDNHRERPDGHVELEGRIAAVDAAARTIRVGATDVSVPATATVRHGATRFDISRLQVGDVVHVRATRSGGAVVAEEIESETEHANPEPGDDRGNDPGDDHGVNPGDDHGADAAELNGTIASKRGACPSLTFVVASVPVVTTAGTQFTNGACTTLADGDRVQVKGAARADHTLVAASVEKRNK